MTQFQKKPVVIDAVQLRWTQWMEMCEFLGDIISSENPGRSVETYSDTCGEAGPYIELTIPTAEGDMIARHGDWIIKGIKGEFYPCKPDIFAATYETATPAAEAGETPDNSAYEAQGGWRAMRVYLAAPLFTQAEQEFNLKVAQALRDAGHDVFVPQESQPDFGIGWQQDCFRCDVDGLDWCEVVAAVLDGPDVDSGTAWECGYTWGRGKVVFGLRTDLRTLGDEGAVNLMLERSCRMCKTVAELVASVDEEAARAHEAHGE